jgi:fatty acid/phospholipid biosynthesis enzyme
MVIVVDAGGAAAGLRPVVEGAWRAASEQGHQLVFVGPEEGLRAELRALSAEGGLVSIVDAPAVLRPGEDPVAACREQPESSAMRAA